MRNPDHSLMAILAAAETSTQEAPPEEELRARLDALIKRMPLRSEHERGEHRLICAALNKMQAEAR